MPAISISSTQISRCTALLDEGLQAWRTRPLDETPYVILDARYERVRHANQVVDCAVLVAIGITATGHRRVLGVSVALSEAEVHWRAFLDSLIQRGLRGVKFIASDDYAGLKAARKAMFPGVPWQRCQFHLQHNARGYVSKLDQRTPVARQIRAIFNAGDAHEAHRVGTMVNNMQRAIVLGTLPPPSDGMDLSDPNDVFLLSMALAGEADYLVAGDRRAGHVLHRGHLRTC